jgi:hypothetical protein
MQREQSGSLPINDTMNNNNEAGLTSNAPQGITQHVQFHLGAYEDIMQLSALYIIHDIQVKKKGNTIGNEFKEKAKCSSKRQIGIWARTPAREILRKKINGVRMFQGNSSQHIRILADQVNREIHGP